MLIKKKCINECGRHVMLKRVEGGVTSAVECGSCKSLGVAKSKAEFNNLKKKRDKSIYEAVEDDSD